MSQLNPEVTSFLDKQNHPLRPEIEKLRVLILTAVPGLTENIKWNGPNYVDGDADRITVKIHPPKKIQLIFHRGVAKRQPPPDRLINSNASFLSWKENDRAVAGFQNMKEILAAEDELSLVIGQWIAVTK